MANEALKRWEAKSEAAESFNHKRISREEHLAGRKNFKPRADSGAQCEKAAVSAEG